MENLPPLIPLRAFEMVARLRSVRKAATELGVGHPVVSRHLQTLQDWCGRRLVETSPRGVTLTEDGLMLFRSIGPAMEMIRKAAQDMRPSGAGRVLKIWCVAGFAARWLAPRLDELKRLLPDYEILVRPTDLLPDFDRGEADALIRYGDITLADAESHVLAYPRMFPVASPNYLTSHPRPRSLEELVRAPLIHETSTEQWQSWFTRAGLRETSKLGGLQLWQAHLAIEAAERSQGVALANELILPTGRESSLVELLDTDIRLEPYIFVSPLRHRSTRAVSTLHDWLVSSLQETSIACASKAPSR